jgi:hypothetical protein
MARGEVSAARMISSHVPRLRVLVANLNVKSCGCVGIGGSEWFRRNAS